MEPHTHTTQHTHNTQHAHTHTTHTHTTHTHTHTQHTHTHTHNTHTLAAAEEISSNISSNNSAPSEPVPQAGKDWEFERSKLVQVRKLGEGHFGMGERA